jgi:hypothetical protein
MADRPTHPETWKTLSPEQIVFMRGNKRDSRLREVGGCYALYGDGLLLYIGSTRDLDSRLREHINRYAMYDKTRPLIGDRAGGTRHVTEWVIKYRIARFYGEWATRELRLLRRLSPPLNALGKKRGAA